LLGWGKAPLVLAAVLVTIVLAWLRPKSTNNRSKRQLILKQLTANPPENRVDSSALSRDGKFLAYTEQAGGLNILQVETGKTRALLPSKDSVSVMDWYPDGDHLLVSLGEPDGLWKVSSWDGTSHLVSKA
jgi:WD40 repeat protein